MTNLKKKARKAGIAAVKVLTKTTWKFDGIAVIGLVLLLSSFALSVITYYYANKSTL